MVNSKILFLDLDGVVNSHDFLLGKHNANKNHEILPPTKKERAFAKKLRKHYKGSVEMTINWVVRDLRQVDPKAIALLERFLKESGAGVVISSSWRKGHSIPALQGILTYHGFTGTILDVTPEDVPIPAGFTKYERGHEIQAWLDLNPEVTNFVILDDDSDMAHLHDHFVKTKFKTGLTEANVEAALRLINQPR